MYPSAMGCKRSRLHGQATVRALNASALALLVGITLLRGPAPVPGVGPRLTDITWPANHYFRFGSIGFQSYPLEEAGEYIDCTL